MGHDDSGIPKSRDQNKAAPADPLFVRGDGRRTEREVPSSKLALPYQRHTAFGCLVQPAPGRIPRLHVSSSCLISSLPRGAFLKQLRVFVCVCVCGYVLCVLVAFRLISGGGNKTRRLGNWSPSRQERKKNSETGPGESLPGRGRVPPQESSSPLPDLAKSHLIPN